MTYSFQNIKPVFSVFFVYYLDCHFYALITPSKQLFLNDAYNSTDFVQTSTPNVDQINSIIGLSFEKVVKIIMAE